LAADTGVSTKQFYKVLANAIWDWHWLVSTRPNNGNVLGIGDLTWTPHRFGALGMVVPSIKYTHSVLTHGYFVDYMDLFQSKLYSRFGFRGVREQGQDRYILFGVSPIPVEVIKKFSFTVDEAILWRQLIECYASQSADVLNACASCRNHTTAFHSLWFQFVVWRRNMTVLMTRLRDTQVARSNESDRLIKSAQFSVKQLQVKLKYYENRELHISAIRAAAEYTELGTQLPFLNEGKGWSEDSMKSLTDLQRLIPLLEALHELMLIALSSLGLGGLSVDSAAVDNSLEIMARWMPGLEQLLQPNVWHSLLLLRDGKRVGAISIELVNSTFDFLSKESGLQFRRVSDHYRVFLENYPLPTEGFIVGF
jgi:hypothetical protein